MVLEAKSNAELESRFSLLEETVRKPSGLDALRNSFLSFGLWVCRNPPSREDNAELWIDRYCKLLEFSAVQQDAAAEFLLCLGLLIVYQPNISSKRKAEWSKHLSQSIFVSTSSEFLLYSLVHSYLHQRNASSSAAYHQLMEEVVRILSRVGNVLDSASESSTVLNDILPLILSLQHLASVQRDIPATVGLRLDLLSSLFSEFSDCLSKLFHFLLRERCASGSLCYDHKRLQNGIYALLYIVFRLFSDCVSLYGDALYPVATTFVSFALQLLETCDTCGMCVEKKLCYPMVCTLLQRDIFQSSKTRQLLILIQCEVMRWYDKFVVKEERKTELMNRDGMEEEIKRRFDDKVTGNETTHIGHGNLLWALKTWRIYHQSIFYRMERDHQIIERRNALDSWLWSFCDSVEQIPNLRFLRRTLSKYKRWLNYPPTQQTTVLPISSLDNESIGFRSNEKEPSDSETNSSRRKEAAGNTKRKHGWKSLQVIRPIAPVNISPVEDNAWNENTTVSRSKKLALQVMNNVEISCSNALDNQQQVSTKQTAVESLCVQTGQDNEEAFYRDESDNQSSYSDVDDIVDEIDLNNSR